MSRNLAMSLALVYPCLGASVLEPGFANPYSRGDVAVFSVSIHSGDPNHSSLQAATKGTITLRIERSDDTSFSYTRSDTLTCLGNCSPVLGNPQISSSSGEVSWNAFFSGGTPLALMGSSYMHSPFEIHSTDSGWIETDNQGFRLELSRSQGITEEIVDNLIYAESIVLVDFRKSNSSRVERVQTSLPIMDGRSLVAHSQAWLRDNPSGTLSLRALDGRIVPLANPGSLKTGILTIQAPGIRHRYKVLWP